MSLCIAVVVGGGIYQRYLPMFIYFCLKSYPEVGVRVFLLGKLLKKYNKIINKLNSMGDVVVKEDCFAEYPKSNQELKTLRWVLDKGDFNDYNNIYIGDVDLLICKETPPLEEQHLKHCKDTGLPYSNMVRPNSKHRLSGLHFIKKEGYYNTLKKQLIRCSNKLKSGELKGVRNETSLYNLVKPIGFPSKHFWSHHGIHLGYWRNGRRKRDISEKVWDIVSKESYKTYYKFFKEVSSDSLFKEVEKAVVLKEIKYMDEYLSKLFKKER